jgi:hypothetical protein
MRVFDLRDKEHSTIIYESPRQGTPLLRLGWNKQDPRYMAAVTQVRAGRHSSGTALPAAPRREPPLDSGARGLRAAWLMPSSVAWACSA